MHVFRIIKDIKYKRKKPKEKLDKIINKELKEKKEKKDKLQGQDNKEEDHLQSLLHLTESQKGKERIFLPTYILEGISK